MNETDTQKQIINISWKYNKNDGSYYPTMTLFDHASNEEQIIMLRNYNFNYMLTTERYCPGYHYLDGYHPCPYNNILNKDSYSQCFYCDKKQGFREAFLFQGQANEFMQEYLKQKHYIYLAYFEPGIIKVGTAAESRKYLRPIEQDALVYMFIAESDGFSIQDLEHTISKEIGITEAVNSSHKFRYLNQKPNIDKAKKLLMSNFDRIHDRYKGNEKFSSWIIEKPELVDLSGFVTYPEDEVYKVKNSEIDYLIGKFHAIRGRYTIFESNNTLLAIDERKIIGKYIKSYQDNYQYKVENKKSKHKDQLSMI
ncbi:DUF2797 domain-containing protein [Candidatus Dojkabacteria bacterium]|uniref:DUF2797 domain-containing protein n=1 Tax=Candidatus Dojkabacteria bacterium TaxID=2099670 RepID=A0A955L1X2_9BACT|nr:DUF2797 domain-containing protein [Candidatus Dojkabacteria bacterium]